MIGDGEQVGRAAARTDEVLPSHLIGVTCARIPDRRDHVVVETNVGKARQNGAAVAVGRGVDAKAGLTEPLKRRANEVSGRVKALGQHIIPNDVLPRDDEAAVGKGSHVVGCIKSAVRIEDVDENVALDEDTSGIIDRRAETEAAAGTTERIRPTYDEPAVGQSSDVR